VLRYKPENVEDVQEQRKYINSLAANIAQLMQDVETTKVMMRAGGGDTGQVGMRPLITRVGH